MVLYKETALIYEFTMLELMYYFGILYRMNMKYTRKRTEFLKEFLNLPTIHRKCGVMRYSFVLLIIVYLSTSFLTFSAHKI